MYTLIIAVTVGLLITVLWIALGLWGGIWLGTILGILVMVGISALVARRIGKRIEPAMQSVQRQIQAGQTRLALQTLESLLPMAKWQVLLGGQLHAQIGTIHYAQGEEAKAMESLSKSHARVAEAQLFRAALLYRKNDVDGATKALRGSVKYNQKNALLHNTLAWMLSQSDRTDEAIAALQEALKSLKDDSATKDNLIRLQNGKKMSMKSFGMTWYGLQLEKVPNALRQMQQGPPRPGFRQPRRRR
ncbi:MAG: tetratricopeptide repeat protein [Candidatus Eisenbacteria bacterium]|uniref:Tetratricopeptide repeat protein n=1 Tax=Eiseniibacteriota bacterium TaxID=2212470 RepID=A0A956SCG6_UNCEI|nr:tetratricopeptide repeat protein [Candidatus Eisenbacteria bacterium]MCB9465498.1 tetratricopeptide repeat protein [Candidatus Eisenbacteria bacterium]